MLQQYHHIICEYLEADPGTRWHRGSNQTVAWMCISIWINVAQRLTRPKRPAAQAGKAAHLFSSMNTGKEQMSVWSTCMVHCLVLPYQMHLILEENSTFHCWENAMITITSTASISQFEICRVTQLVIIITLLEVSR